MKLSYLIGTVSYKLTVEATQTTITKSDDTTAILTIPEALTDIDYSEISNKIRLYKITPAGTVLLYYVLDLEAFQLSDYSRGNHETQI
jgi:hypothetical protein